jgi:hypothetical protein
MVKRVRCNDEEINDRLELMWQDGWALVDMHFPAGMIWAILVFEKVPDDHA